jgi:N-acetylmuramoyl-L-alanine amidase
MTGANMPGILIEIGQLTNPAEEKKLSDRAYLTTLADECVKAVTNYSGNAQETFPPPQ